MFDRILEQVAGQFGLRQDQARQLLGMVVSLIFNPRHGGPAGFVQAFRDQGLGDVVGSWLGHGPNQTINAAQLEGVVGSEALGHISRKLGLPQATVSSAAAALLPDAVNELSEHGDLPTSAAGIPDKLKTWFGAIGVADSLGQFGQWGAATAGAGAAAVGPTAHPVGDATGRTADAVGAGMPRSGAAPADTARVAKSGIGRLLPWLLIGAALIAAVLLFRGCDRREAEVAAPAATAPAAAETPAAAVPAARFDSRLVLSRNGDKLTYDGVVDSEATKAAVIDALNKAYGAANVSGNITVDANARTPGWLAALSGFLPQFSANGAALTFEGNRIDLNGNAADADKAGLLDRLKAAFGGYRFGGLFEGLGAAAANVEGAAAKALDKLTPGKFDADELVKALNLMIIHFASGGANISAESDDILKQAAKALKAAPASSIIEVGGHTDSTGNAATNQRLSTQRAEAVKRRLVELGVDGARMTSQGFGQDKPVADNASADGRAKNRRIEFTVQEK